MNAVEVPGRPPKLFLGYSHKDEKHILELKKDLTQMERNGEIHSWYDRALGPGEKMEFGDSCEIE